MAKVALRRVKKNQVGKKEAHEKNQPVKPPEAKHKLGQPGQ
jgi:hypothetical protein